MIRACCEVQQVSGLPSTRQDLPSELSRVELTLEESRKIRGRTAVERKDEVLDPGVFSDETS